MDHFKGLQLKPLLSICIPTYNRSKYLNEAISSIISQITSEYYNLIELCISDNFSTDNTDEVIHYWKKSSSLNIIYHKNSENMGADQNYIQVVKIANSDFCWFLGSDDKMEPGALDHILTLIKARSADIIIGSRYDYNFEMTHKLNNPVPPLEKLFSEPHIFNNTLEAISNTTYALGYLSILIFNREKWNAIQGYEPYLGTAYVHVYILLSMMKYEAKTMYYPIPIVGWRSDNDFFLEDLKLFGRIQIDVEGYYKIAGDVFGYHSIEHRTITNLILDTHFPVYGRISGLKISGNLLLDVKYLILFIHYYWTFPKFWIKKFPFLIVPSLIYKMMHYFYHLLKKQKRCS